MNMQKVYAASVIHSEKERGERGERERELGGFCISLLICILQLMD